MFEAADAQSPKYSGMALPFYQKAEAMLTLASMVESEEATNIYQTLVVQAPLAFEKDRTTHGRAFNLALDKMVLASALYGLDPSSIEAAQATREARGHFESCQRVDEKYLAVLRNLEEKQIM